MFHLAKQTQTPRSAFTQIKKSYLFPNSQYHEVFDPVHGSLEEQRKDLEIKKGKLDVEMRKVVDKLNKIERQQEILEDLDDELKYIDSQSSLIGDNRHMNKEANEQRTMLQKIGADIKQHIEVVIEELQDEAVRLRQKTRDQLDIEILRSIEKKINDKEVEILTLRELSDALNKEIVTRENEVIQIEQRAIQHQNEIDKVQIRKRELLYLKMDGERNKEIVLKEIHRIQREKELVSNRAKFAQTKLDEALKESQRLDQLEMHLNQKEESLKVRNQEINEMKMYNAKARVTATKNRSFLKEKREIKQLEEMRRLGKEEDEINEAIADLEYKNEFDEKKIATKSRGLAVTKESADKAFNTMKSRLATNIDRINSNVMKRKTHEELLFEIKQAKTNASFLTANIQTKKREIKEVKILMKPEEQINQMKCELQKRVKSIMIQERETNSDFVNVRQEEEEIEADEEEMRQNFTVLEAEKNLIKQQDAATEAMIQISKERLKDLKKKYQILVDQQEKE